MATVKKYRLLKDFPGIGNKGQEVVWSIESQLEYANTFGLVEKWPETFSYWFEEVIEQPTEQPKERIEVRAFTDITTSDMTPGCWKYLFLTYNRPIKNKEFPAIKKAIESILNDDAGEQNKQIPENLEAEFYKVCKELEVTDTLLEQRQRVLDAIPECPAHGKNCVPHAVEWVKKMAEKNDDKVGEEKPFDRYVGELYKSPISKLYNQQQLDEAERKAFAAARETVGYDEPNGVIGYFPTRINKFPNFDTYKQSLSSSPEQKEYLKHFEGLRVKPYDGCTKRPTLDEQKPQDKPLPLDEKKGQRDLAMANLMVAINDYIESYILPIDK